MRAALLGGSGSVSVEGCSGLQLSQLENVLPGSLTLLPEVSVPPQTGLSIDCLCVLTSGFPRANDPRERVCTSE